jgi:hypothetical protein
MFEIEATDGGRHRCPGQGGRPCRLAGLGPGKPSAKALDASQGTACRDIAHPQGRWPPLRLVRDLPDRRMVTGRWHRRATFSSFGPKCREDADTPA